MEEIEQEEIEVTDDLLDRVKLWLSEHKDDIPIEIRLIVTALVQSHETFKELLRKNKTLRRLLAVHMGQVPKSERSVQASQTKSDDLPQKKKSTKKNKKRKKMNKTSPDNASPHEAMYTKSPHKTGEIDASEKEVARLEKFSSNVQDRLVSSFTEREFIDVKFSIVRKIVRIETVKDPVTGQTETAEFNDAPEGSRYSFDTMLWMVYLHAQCFLPMHRLERMFGIARSSIYYMLRYVVTAFAPVYVQLGKDLAKHSRYIYLDDTKERTLEKPSDKVPEETDLLEGEALGVDVDLLNFVSRGFNLPKLGATSERKKKKLNHTVLIGDSELGDATSSIVFHMTHQGQAGDLLSKLLNYRNKHSPKNIDLICDLLPANLPSVEQQKRHRVRVSGCSAHARRPFWKNRGLDDHMYWFIRAFKALASLEGWIKNEDMTFDRILQLRSRYGYAIWQLIFKESEAILKKWPGDSAPTKAANYILNHRAELTRYLKNPRLPATNSLSERALRREKLMLANSKFRATLEGRIVLDVIITIMGTCIRARIPWNEYAIDVLRNRKSVALNPELWTPKVWQLRRIDSENKV